MTLLVTGATGFIGYFVCEELLKNGHKVIGIDNMNPYYDVGLKEGRLNLLQKSESFEFHKVDLTDRESLKEVFQKHKFDKVINLAAQAGVRYSLENPQAYIDSNVSGFLNVILLSKEFGISHLVYASSSSIYGNNKEIPFTVDQRTDSPVSIYAATKRMNELMAHTYSHLYNLPCTGLRFFTVYGPWGRPDMAPFLFTKALFENKKIKVFNNGDMLRDFTYVEDIASGVVKVTEAAAPAGAPPAVIHNIGNCTPVKLMDFITTLEEVTGKVANKEFLPMQDGDVYATYADVSTLVDAVGFQPQTSLKEGITNFVNWYKSFYKVD